MPYNPASLANLRPRPWQPGHQSPNPRGAHRGYKRILAKSRKASEEAIDVAIKCMRDREARWADRLKACELLLDRGYGAPDKQALQFDREIGAAASVLRIEFVSADEHAASEPQTINGTPRLIEVQSDDRDIDEE